MNNNKEREAQAEPVTQESLDDLMSAMKQDPPRVVKDAPEYLGKLSDEDLIAAIDTSDCQHDFARRPLYKFNGDGSKSKTGVELDICSKCSLLRSLFSSFDIGEDHHD